MRTTKTVALCLLLVSCLNCRAETDFREKVRDTCRAHINDPVPKYKIERTLKIKSTHLIYLFIAIAPDDLKRDSLIALGCTVGRKYHDWDSVSAEIFTSSHSALNFHLPQGEGNALDDIRDHKARYICNRSGDPSGQQVMYNDDPNSPYMTVVVNLGNSCP